MPFQHSISFVALLIFSAGHAAANVPWRTARVTLHAPEQRSVADLLKEFATGQGLPITTSPEITGVVSGEFLSVPTETMLNTLCDAGNCTWFYDGGRLNIDGADEMLTRTVTVSTVTRDMLEEALASVGFASGPPGSESVVKGANRAGLLLLSGGPRYIQAAETVAREMDSRVSKRAATDYTVRTYKLKYASAQDISVRSGSTSTQVPGVATLLQNLMAPQAGRSGSTGPVVNEIPRSGRGLRGTGLAAIGGPVATGNGSLPAAGISSGAGAGLASINNPAFATQGISGQGARNDDAAADQPIIVGDPRLNAVIVRDLASRIPLYDDLLKMLDVPAKAIEITASIVDVDKDFGFDFGFEYLSNYTAKDGNIYRGGFNADRGVFDGTGTANETPSFIDGTNLARGAGLNVTGLIGGKGFDLLTRLRAMETAGKGKIVSSPSVMTLENNEAIIRSEETIYVRVAGERDVDLFDVSAGVVLRVTPTLLEEQDGTLAYRLLLDVQDGSFLESRVDTVPGTRTSAITTQALVPDNKTLLIGGYFVERKTETESRVPYLGRIPVIGNAFKRKEKTNDRKQRFFFITPHLVRPALEARRALRVVPTPQADEARGMANDAWASRDPGPPLPQKEHDSKTHPVNLPDNTLLDGFEAEAPEPSTAPPAKVLK